MSHESEEKVFTKLNIIRSSMRDVILLNGEPHIRVGVTHGTGRLMNHGTAWQLDSIH